MGGKPENPEKKTRSLDKNQQQTQPTCDAGSGNQTQATTLGGKCSHHCAIPPPHLSQCRYAFCFKSTLTLFFFFSLQAGLTPCVQERINSKGYTGSTLPGRYSPDCDRDGNYKPSQCQVSSGVCWCVDSQGQEIPGTRGRGKRPCPAPGKINITL